MRILFIDTVHPFLKKELENQKYICDTAYSKNKSETEKIIAKYEGIIIRSKFKIDKHFISKGKKLKFIARAGSGLENIDCNYATKKGIQCFNTPSGNKQAVAEHATGLLLALFNNLTTCDSEIRKGIWRREENRGLELSKKTVGIIGFGNNGSAFAKILTGFGVQILAYDKYLKNYNYKSTMRMIYEKADILSLHIPLTKETTYLINENYINKFKKNIYIINTSRGKCIHTKSLVQALKNGKIKGACLDVFENEKSSFQKISNNKELAYLKKTKKTLLSPHIAGWTKESNLKIAKILLQKIINYNV